jgi:hypothetical protein
VACGLLPPGRLVPGRRGLLGRLGSSGRAGRLGRLRRRGRLGGQANHRHPGRCWLCYVRLGGRGLFVILLYHRWLTGRHSGLAAGRLLAEDLVSPDQHAADQHEQGHSRDADGQVHHQQAAGYGPRDQQADRRDDNRQDGAEPDH